jgi:hypothetical protein
MGVSRRGAAAARESTWRAHVGVAVLLHKVHVVHAVQVVACASQPQHAALSVPPRSRRRAQAGAPDRMTTSSTSLFLTSANSQEYWRTASAVPWNHSVPPVPGVCVAASTCGAAQQISARRKALVPRQRRRTSTKPSPPKRMPLPKLYVRDMWRFRDVELNCVARASAVRRPGDADSERERRARRAHLRQHVHLADAAVDAVAHGHINQAVRAADGHRRLCALLGQGIQARARAAAQDDRRHALAGNLLDLQRASVRRRERACGTLRSRGARAAAGCGARTARALARTCAAGAAAAAACAVVRGWARLTPCAARLRGRAASGRASATKRLNLKLKARGCGQANRRWPGAAARCGRRARAHRSPASLPPASPVSKKEAARRGAARSAGTDPAGAEPGAASALRRARSQAAARRQVLRQARRAARTWRGGAAEREPAGAACAAPAQGLTVQANRHARAPHLRAAARGALVSSILERAPEVANWRYAVPDR